jgi:acetolactate synthase-1/2/3 large subunit
MSDAQPQATALLARFVLETKIEAIPDNVRHEGIRSLVNIIGCALGARFAQPDAPIVATMGDGTFGFHMAEFDTAVTHRLPFVAVVGNDAKWNAEYQIQVRAFGANRARGCEMRPLRYDAVASAMGAHGELVTHAEEMLPAVQRALASGLPACINVMIESIAAPVIRLG